MIHQRPAPARILVAALAALAFSGAHADPALDQARQMIDQGNPAAAYHLLEAQEIDRAGDPDFDFVFGLAALDSGHKTRAVFAFERVLALQPNNSRARAEMARAYLLLGENRAAKAEFETVKQQGVPEGVAATIDRLLSMIEKAENRSKPSLKGFVELSAGADSNVNSATDNATVAVPGLGTATLNANSVEQGDAYGALAAGLAYRQPIGEGHFLTGDLNANGRWNADHSQFDTRSVDGALGWQLSRGGNTFTAAANASKFQRDGADLRDTVGISAQWQHDYDAIHQATLFAQYAALSYPGQTIRDADRYVLGAGYAEAVASRTVVFGSLYGGEEVEKASTAPHLGHVLGGLRIGTLHRLDERWSILANTAYEKRKYGGVEPLFTDKREDDQFEAGVGISYQADPRWRLGARVVYVNSDSNIPVYQYDRTIASLSARYDF